MTHYVAQPSSLGLTLSRASRPRPSNTVIPAHAGVQSRRRFHRTFSARHLWMPAFAGMTTIEQMLLFSNGWRAPYRVSHPNLTFASAWMAGETGPGSICPQVNTLLTQPKQAANPAGAKN